MSKTTLARVAKQRDDHECQKCGRDGGTASLHAHHIHPQWAGGEDSLENLVTLCPHCHRYAPEKRREEKARRATEEYLSAGLRPEFDMFLYGAVYGAREFSDAGEANLSNLADELVSVISDLRADDDSWGADSPSDVYNILYWCYKLSAARDERVNAALEEIENIDNCDTILFDEADGRGENLSDE